MKKLFILLTMLLFVVSNTLMAQSDEPFTASVKVQFKTGDEVTTKPLRYALFKTAKKANEIKAILEATMPEISNGTNPLAFDEAVTKNKLSMSTLKRRRLTLREIIHLATLKYKVRAVIL